MTPMTPMTPLQEPRPEMDDRPPILGSWRNIYAVVLATLVVIVALLALLTAAYA